MRALTVEDLRTLVGSHTPPCLSLYLPTHRNGSPEDKHHFEGAVRNAREVLDGSMKPNEIESFLEPVVGLSTPAFWQEHSEGLAVFRSRDHMACYRLPVTVPETLIAADSFHIRPLIRFLQSNQRYFLLSLSQNYVRLFKGSAIGLSPVNVEGLPRSLEDALGQEERGRSVRVHYGSSGGKNPIYGGAGKSDTSRDEDLLRFFRAVDEALWPLLRDEKVPMILVAPQRELPIYRSVSRYAHIAEQGVHGNFSEARMEDLHARAWPIVQAIVDARTEEIRERYDKLVSRARALDEIRGIATYAIQGRVHQLLLARDVHLWGRLDRSSGAVELHGKDRAKGDDDVLDDLAEAVLVRGGEVFSLDATNLPSKSPVAAILRW
jgi:hypothetical protein